MHRLDFRADLFKPSHFLGHVAEPKHERNIPQSHSLL
uniref:Uncharacterized protein n=1 Tax=Arundo donax TaxID=35708 RepID=A0A0A9C781_ARUDO